MLFDLKVTVYYRDFAIQKFLRICYLKYLLFYEKRIKGFSVGSRALVGFRTDPHLIY